MQLIDWIFIALPLLMVLAMGIYTRRYATSVAGFLSGGRLAGRYLLAVASGESSAGVIVFVAAFEALDKAGFTLNWWNTINTPLWLILGLSGFVVYRYRQTMAMTLAQFFEIRYSRRFRIFTGMLGFIAGIMNFGIIPAVSARFFVIIFNLPEHLTLFSFHMDSYVLLMAVFISITLVVVLSGGVLTIMLTNCAEGVASLLLYLVVIGCMLAMFRWSEISQVLEACPPGQSLLNPFDSFAVKDFNIWNVLMGMFITVYGTMAWQYQSGYNSASKSAHESRMAGLLGGWRGMAKGLAMTLLGLCALTYLKHPDFASQAGHVQGMASQIADAHTRKQMLMPIALTQLLPVGVKGALCVTFLMGMFGGDAMHMHSWGGIFVQDVLIPLRKKPFSPKEHIFILRLAITGVGIFAFFFGWLFRQTEYIFMWWIVTSAIYVGGAGAAIIGGLYWKKGTTAGAWSSVLTGSILSISGIIARQICGEKFLLNGQQIGFFAAIAASIAFVVVSLLTCREDFNMDRMLHRGEYANGGQASQSQKKVGLFRRITGINEDFSAGDKWIAISLVAWGILWFGIFVVGTVWNLVAPWPTSVWSNYWRFTTIAIPCPIALITVLWFAWGGSRDMIDLFRNLRNFKANDLDDGTVVGHQSLADVMESAEQHGKEKTKEQIAAQP
jgi:solute:Na+ symporter, SSS family